ncbi:hypothetical protein ABPG72_021011 [Tetrahymena utriculariae]
MSSSQNQDEQVWKQNNPEVFQKLKYLYNYIGEEFNCLEFKQQYEDMSKEKKSAKNYILQIWKSLKNIDLIHILWYFIQPSEENLKEKELLEVSLKEEYKAKAFIKSYLEMDLFLDEIETHGFIKNPIYLIISCQCYNSQNQKMQDCLNKIKQIKERNKNIRLQKIILQVQDEESSLNLKDVAEKISLEHKVILYKDISNEIFMFMVPQEFRRVIPLKDINQFFHCKNMKEHYLSLHSVDYSEINLFDFQPDKIQLEEKLKKAVQIIDSRKIKVDPLILSPNLPKRLPRDILVQYKEARKDEQDLCKRIIKLYTMETCFMHKFVNGCLYTLNAEVINLIWDLILMVRVALYKYNDLSETVIKKDNTQPIKLYRGIQIQQEYFQKIIKVGEIICLASFSSFSLSKQVAYDFIQRSDKYYQDKEPLIFELEYSSNSSNFHQRPKAIFEQSKYQLEHEYLLPPGCIFKIEKIEQKDNQFNCYKVHLSQVENIQI